MGSFFLKKENMEGKGNGPSMLRHWASGFGNKWASQNPVCQAFVIFIIHNENFLKEFRWLIRPCRQRQFGLPFFLPKNVVADPLFGALTPAFMHRSIVNFAIGFNKIIIL
jgi:hypothetical protein